MEDYKTVQNDSEAEMIERKSRFIGYCRPVKTQDEAIDFINEIRSIHRQATHNVYAYVLREDNIMRYSDDGEPAGTAGVPVLEVIKKEGLTDIAVVVTRYFGGILLGAGGLVRAYSHSAAIAVEGAGIITYEPYSEVELRCGYSEYQKYSNILANEGAIIDGTDFEADVLLRFAVKRSRADALLKKITETGNGRDIPLITGERYDYR